MSCFMPKLTLAAARYSVSASGFVCGELIVGNPGGANHLYRGGLLVRPDLLVLHADDAAQHLVDPVA
jgi:hypothetical protein